MKEWSNQDRFSSYNSWKCCFYEKWFRGIVEWYKNPDYKILPPIEASMDASPNGACNLRCRWCVDENEKITLAYKDNKKAKDVKKDDILLAYDEKKKKIVETTVKETFNRKVKNYLEITLDDGKTLKVTGEHPLFVNNKWIEASKITVGMEVLVMDWSDKNSYMMTKKNIVDMKKDYESNGIECLFVNHKDFYKNKQKEIERVLSFVEEVEKCPHYVKVTTIKTIKKEITVVNFQCSPYNNFFTNYILAHNCNANKYLNKTSLISDQQMAETTKFLVDWKIPAFCWGGLGDSTLRKNLPYLLNIVKDGGSSSGIATNGTMFSDELIDSMANCCRWVGVSVDAATNKTFKDTKGVDLLSKVFTNMRKLVKKTKEVNTLCEVSYKFLVTPWNYKEIYDACKIAKDIGVRDFYVRIADLSHQGMGEKKVKKYDFMVEEIMKQFEECHMLRTDDFRVFTSTHKFNSDLKPRKDFKQCWAMPLLIQCCPDGNVYGCVDQRLQPYFKLGSYIPNPKEILNFWGSKKHWELTFKEGFKRCSSRCTFTFYNEVCEKLFIEEDKDVMCRYFT